MGTYNPPTISNYNDNPPTNDGSENFTDNGVDWDKNVIGEVGDPLNNYSDAISSETEDAFDKIDAITKRIEDFGASPTTGFDNKNAFESAVVWLAAQTAPAALVFAGGRYEYSLSPNWAVGNAQMIASGVVFLRYTGTANAFTLDGGAAGGGVYNMKVDRFIIECPSTGLDAVYMRAMHHCDINLNIRGAGTASNGIEMLWCVANRMYVTVSSNEVGSWYSSGKPLVGVLLDKRGSGELTAFNSFINPLLEVCGTGLKVSDGIGNMFYGGALESCSTVGAELTTGAASTRFFGTDFETNGPTNAGPDINCNGNDNEFIGIDTFSEIIFESNSFNNRVLGGAHREIQLDSGARTNTLTSITIDRFGSTPAGVIDDNGTDTLIRDVVDNAGNYTTLQGITLNPTSFPAKVDIDASVGGSPFTYTNSGIVSQGVGVLPDQSITTIQYGRVGNEEVIATTHGMWELDPGDKLIVTYPGTAPSMKSWDRAR